MIARPVCALLVLLAACRHPAPRDPDFAPDAVLTLVGSGELRGRAAIDEAAKDWLADATVTTGRTWRDASTRVIEFVVHGALDGHLIGATGAAVVALDGDGRAIGARVYLDLVTLAGQVDPTQLPEGATVRAPIATPLDGTAAITAAGTATERANLATAGEIWAHLDAHDPDGVLATASDDYVYDDFSGPAPLDRAGTLALLDRWLAMVPDFAIVDKPTFFAAGDDVVTESVEHMTFDGRDVTLHALDVKHFAGGKVVHEWQYANGVEVWTEVLGLPAPQVRRR